MYDHLDELESEAMFIIREVYAQFENPGILFSGGKDSIVMSYLAKKSIFPSQYTFSISSCRYWT